MMSLAGLCLVRSEEPDRSWLPLLDWLCSHACVYILMRLALSRLDGLGVRMAVLGLS